MTELFIFRTALRDFLRFRRLWIWIGLALVAFMIAGAWRADGASSQEVYSQLVEGMVFKVVALSSAIFTTSIVSNEVEQRTISYLLTRPIERWRLLLSRFFASALTVALVGIASVIAVAAAAFQGSLDTGQIAKDVAAIIFGALGYGGLFLFISLIVNRAMIVCLLFAFAWETAIPNMPGEVYYLSIFSYMKAIAAHPQFELNNPLGLFAGALGTASISRGMGFAALIIVSAGLLVLACWWFSSFEYVPREDAE